jgi:hypothetical protein
MGKSPINNIVSPYINGKGQSPCFSHEGWWIRGGTLYVLGALFISLPDNGDGQASRAARFTLQE